MYVRMNQVAFYSFFREKAVSLNDLTIMSRNFLASSTSSSPMRKPRLLASFSLLISSSYFESTGRAYPRDAASRSASSSYAR